MNCLQYNPDILRKSASQEQAIIYLDDEASTGHNQVFLAEVCIHQVPFKFCDFSFKCGGCVCVFVCLAQSNPSSNRHGPATLYEAMTKSEREVTVRLFSIRLINSSVTDYTKLFYKIR